jgi:GAF domain-containing protein/HAMP domain-containing protein
MNLNKNPLPAELQRAQNAYWVSVVFTLAFLSMSVVYAYLASQTSAWQLYALAGLMAMVAVVSAYSNRLSRAGRIDLGTGLTLAAILIALPVSSILISGLGLYLGIAQFIGISLVIALVISRKYLYWAGTLNLASASLTVLLDVTGPVDRYQLPMVRIIIPAIVALGLLVFVILLVRNLGSLSLRAKITLGIIATGGIALAVLSFFAMDRAGRIADSLSERLETSVSLLAEEQLVNTAYIESDLANQFFNEITNEVNSLAQYRVSLQSQQEILGQGMYWDAASKLVPLAGGHYGNSANDISSVFVPAFTRLDESVFKELNTSAYLDLSVLQSLEENPAILAVYYIDPKGIVRYYPNIELASLLPPDFDATKRPYYEITAPLFNPQRLTRWTIPYADAAGGGLVVTVASPVYYGDKFSGVVAADIQLSVITEQISSIKVGQTGYAYMIDDAGRIISMPRVGHDLFGLDPDELPGEEFFKQTVLGQGTEEMSAVTRRMVAGGSGLGVLNINGVETYVSYAPIKSNGYSLALVVPVSEMQSAIEVARNETQAQTRSSIQTAALILIALLVGATIVSLGLGQIIAAPVVRLTQTANNIVEGNLSAQAVISSRDEIGTLAHAFNSMTSRLRETLEGLEQRVEERTAELLSANQSNERRARQFESIARVARTISSTRDLDSLLTQITTVINREFGFYHVGIFLVDEAKDFAILSAANSEGGQKMLAREHRLKVGETGLVGYVTGTGKPRVALDVGADAVFFNNPDLPDTRSEITLPLRVGEEIFGALDVQSTEPNAFTQEDVNILSTLADQVSIAIQNARQFEETQRALAESESLSRQFIREGWSQFTRLYNIEGIRHSGAKATLLYRKNGKGKAKSPLDVDQPRMKGRGATLSLPVKLRGEIIGSVDVRAPDNRQWDQDELDIVSAILERAAITMENARLLAESQRRAAKERTIGEISAKISALTDIDDLLKTAAQELNHTLPGAEISIQFQKDRDEGA